MPDCVIVKCIDITVQGTLIACIRKYGVFNFSGPDRWSLPVGYLIASELGWLQAAYTRSVSEVVMSAVEGGLQSRAFREWWYASISSLVCSVYLEYSRQRTLSSWPIPPLEIALPHLTMKCISKRKRPGRTFYNVSALSLPYLMKAVLRIFHL